MVFVGTGILVKVDSFVEDEKEYTKVKSSMRFWQRLAAEMGLPEAFRFRICRILLGSVTPCYPFGVGGEFTGYRLCRRLLGLDIWRFGCIDDRLPI